MDDSIHILIVEDSDTQALKLSLMLEEEGWRVSRAATGEEALEQLHQNRPDLVVVDYYLPEMKGDEFCQRVRASVTARDIPILMLTIEEGDTSETRGLASGADDYLSKTVDDDILVMRIRTLLRKVVAFRGEGDRATRTRRPRLLAIDDSPTYLHYLRESLEPEGYAITTAGSGTEGLQRLRTGAFDCVLVDLVMPDMSGTEVCRQISRMRTAMENPTVVLMLTASESKDDMTSGLEAGADDFVGKASDIAVLRARIQALLRRKFLQDENQRGIEELKNRQLQEKNEALAAALASAREATQMKSKFLASMSHELRTPLNGIIGFTELLHDGKVGGISDQQRDFLADILRSSRHLLQLINDILDISKIEAGKMEFHPEWLDVEAVVLEVKNGLRPLASEKRIETDIQVHPECARAKLDSGKLKQVLYNYLSNALKFTQPDGRIQVRILPEPPDLLNIEVEDSGVGISEENVSRLFTEFEQLQASGHARHRGTGLGLALTKRIVEAQGGTVAVRSVLGSGSTFSAKLPRVPVPRAELVPV